MIYGHKKSHITNKNTLSLLREFTVLKWAYLSFHSPETEPLQLNPTPQIQLYFQKSIFMRVLTTAPASFCSCSQEINFIYTE